MLRDCITSMLYHLADYASEFLPRLSLKFVDILKLGSFRGTMKRLILVLIYILPFSTFGQSTWMGLTIAPENRCSPFNKDEQYQYKQSGEDKVIALMNGNIYGPYTGRYFDSKRETDLGHIVRVSEIHDSCLCAASDEVRRQFTNDV